MRQTTFNTAYSKVFLCRVELVHTYSLVDGRQVWWCCNEDEGIINCIHTADELEDFCL